jgi:hypothetical protein
MGTVFVAIRRSVPPEIEMNGTVAFTKILLVDGVTGKERTRCEHADVRNNTDGELLFVSLRTPDCSGEQ